MKQRYRLNNDGSEFQAMVWEHNNQIIVRIYESRNIHSPGKISCDNEIIFNSIDEYNEWLKNQEWVEPKKTFKYGNFKKVPQSINKGAEF